MSGRALYQAALRMAQASSKADSTVKKIPARRFSSASALDSKALKAANAERIKRSEESLRTVMFLSCWGPN